MSVLEDTRVLNFGTRTHLCLKLGVISRLYNGTALTIADTVAYYLLLQSIAIPS